MDRVNKSFDEVTKQQIVDEVAKGTTKAAVARMFGCSPRTIGRVLDEMKSKGVGIYPVAPPSDERLVCSEKKAEKPVGIHEEEDSPRNEYAYFVVSDGNLINVTRIRLDGSEPPHSEIAFKGSENYDKALSYYKAGDAEKAYQAISMKFKIESMCVGLVTFDPDTSSLYYCDGPNRFVFPANLYERVSALVSEGKSATSLLNFANRLAANPSPRAVKELYGFVKAMDVEITEEGMIRCYKRVRGDYKDCYTGTYDNSPGQVVSMPRHMVNDDSAQTCSHGLHVCSKDYLQHFYGDVIVLVEVDPADFVSIPADYNDTKARVCKYTVLKDVSKELFNKI